MKNKANIRLSYGSLEMEKVMSSFSNIYVESRSADVNLYFQPESKFNFEITEAIYSAGNDIEIMRNTYNERRIYMLHRLQKMGFVVHAEPKGAFYIYCDARKFTSDSLSFALEVLEKAHVGITPGIDFGTNGEGFIRLSYANSIENIKTGMDRLEAWLKENFSQ